MGKDREGKFHPKKGKPSGEGSTGIKDINTELIDNHLEIAEKYTVGEEEPGPNVHVRHRNRNTDKHENKSPEKKDINDRNGSFKSKSEALSESDGSAGAAEELPVFLNREQLQQLAAITGDPCISVYIPTHSAGVEKNEQKDTIAFKNQLQQITYQLRQKGIDQSRIDTILKPGYDLLRDSNFWLTQSKGLAVFLSEGQCKYLKLPFEPKETLIVNSSYYMAPLIPLMTGYDYFYILVLSKKQAKLYRADKFGMVYLPISEMPRGIEDVVHVEEKDDQKLFRTGSSGAGQGANFHGIGGGKPDEKQNLAMYFDEVDETALKHILNKENVPLLLAGVEYLIPIYKSVAEYKNIWHESLTGSYEHGDGNLLYNEALNVMQPYFRARSEKALEMFGNNSATALTSSIASDVIPAAYYSRVWHLFVQKDEHIWGTFDEMKNELSIHNQQEEGDEELIDKAIIRTILNGGEVHVLEKDRMPADSKIAALMRYEA